MRWLLSLVLLSLPLWATTYHVDKVHGSDSNTCRQAQSAAAAKATVSGASGGYSCLANGQADVLIIHAGAYAETLSLTKSGAGAGSEMVIKASAGDTVKLKRWAQGASPLNYVKIGGDKANEGLQFTDQGDPTIRLAEFGQNTNYQASYLTIQNSVYGGTNQGGGGAAQCLRGGFGDGAIVSHVSVTNNVFQWCGQGADQPWRAGQSYTSATVVMPSNPSKLATSRAYRVTTPGRSADPEPTWALTCPNIGNTCTDGGGVVYTAVAGLQAGAAIFGNNVLWDGNTFVHLTDGMQQRGDYSIIRNNTFTASYTDLGCTSGNQATNCNMAWYHVDFFDIQNTVPMRYTLLEGNTLTQNDSANGHWGVFLVARGNTLRYVMHRFNLAYNTNNGFGLYPGGAQNNCENCVQYNNTAADFVGRQAKASSWSRCSGSGCPNGASLNNVYDTVTICGSDVLGAVGDTLYDYDLFYQKTCPSMPFTGEAAAERHAIRNVDPLYMDRAGRNYRPRDKSRLIGGGRYLATIDASDPGAGTTLVLNKSTHDAKFFADGKGGSGSAIGATNTAVGDYIAVGNGSCSTAAEHTAQITAINYATDTLTTDVAISYGRASAHVVCLWKDSRGNVVPGLEGSGATPNIGALASTQSDATPRPASLTFPNTRVGDSSTGQVVTLTNTSNATLRISSIRISGDFAKSTTCGGTLAAFASCTVTVAFTPTAPGTRTGTLIFSDDAPDTPQTVRLSAKARLSGH